MVNGQESITLGLRVSGDHQGDIAHGRTLDSAPYLRISYNTAPGTPTDLHVDQHPCTDPNIMYAPFFDLGVPLSGVATDPMTHTSFR